MPKLKNQPSQVDIICNGCSARLTVSYKFRKKKYCSQKCYLDHKDYSFLSTSERKKHLSEIFSGSGNPMFGSHRTLSDETKKKLSDVSRGKSRSEEFKKKVAKGWKKKIDSGYVTWTVGTTAETDERQKRRSYAARIALQNKDDWNIWNTGKSVDTDERVKKNGEAISEALKEKWNTDSEYRQRQTIVVSKNWQNGYRFPNAIEKKVLDILSSSFESNQFIKNMQVDFVDYDRKIIVEVNGDYWHCNPRIFESSYFHKPFEMTAKQVWKRDKMKYDRLQKLGYRVCIIWEWDINHDFDKVVKQITECQT